MNNLRAPAAEYLPSYKSEVLIPCDDNFASVRVLKKHGLDLRDKAGNLVNGRRIWTRRYWITL